MIGLSSLRTLMFTALSLLSAQSPTARATQATQEVQGSPFGVGERLEYEVSFGPIHVGSGTMSVVGMDTVAGEPVWHAMLAISGGIPLFRVRDTSASWFSPSSFTSRRFVQHLREGHYHADRDFRMDPDRGVYWHGASFDSLPSIDPMDDISLLYYVRTLPLLDGDQYEFRRYFQSTGNPIVIRVIRHERITVPAGTFDAVLVEPRIATPGIFADDGRAQVWFSADADRFLLQLKAHVKFGSLSMYLSRITRAGM